VPATAEGESWVMVTVTMVVTVKGTLSWGLGEMLIWIWSILEMSCHQAGMNIRLLRASFPMRSHQTLECRVFGGYSQSATTCLLPYAEQINLGQSDHLVMRTFRYFLPPTLRGCLAAAEAEYDVSPDYYDGRQDGRTICLIRTAFGCGERLLYLLCCFV